MNRKTLLLLLIFAVFLIFTGCNDSPGAVATEPGGTEAPSPQMPTEPEVTWPDLPENPYGPLDFGYEGEYLTCIAGQSMLGIDVSEWQGPIDWEQVAQAGIEFVIIRVAWRGTDQGGLNVDAMAHEYYKGAKEAGLKVGGYIFSQAISPEEAEEEARYLMEQVKDWELDFPLIMDWEYVNDEARSADVSARTLTDSFKAFCETVLQEGYTPMIYFNPAMVWDRIYLYELGDYAFWLAMYDCTMDFPYRVDMWQYTGNGTVPGIDTPVDMNVYLMYE